MSCLDCWEWFVQFVLRCEQSDMRRKERPRPTPKPDKPSKNVNNPDRTKEEPNSNPDFVDIQALGDPDDLNGFRREKFRQLFNRHGYNLAIFPGGHVRGVLEAFNVHAVVELVTVRIGEVRIRSVETGLYLAMHSSGNLYGEGNPEDDSTVFIEVVSQPYIMYLSKKYAHLGWYVGIKRNGEVKNASKTWYPWGQKAVLFSHRDPYPEHMPLRQLRNRHGFVLTIQKDGKVQGSKGDFDEHSVLEFTPSNPPGAFRIRGILSDLYLAMDAKGRLYGESDRLNDNTLFTEHAMGDYFVYLSVRWAHLGWHVGIKRSGKAKKAPKTVYPGDQKAIQFEHLFPYRVDAAWNNIDVLKGPLGDDFPPLAYIDEETED